MGLGIKRFLKNLFYERKWKKCNQHNFTTVSDYYNMQCISVGCYTYGKINLIAARGTQRLILGSYCSIADGVTWVLTGDHSIKFISSFPFNAILFNNNIDAVSKGDIIVDDDVWIGYGATIMSGVHIGQGAVVAAGAVVTKDVPPYAIVGGIPAKIIKYRFESELIEELLKVDYRKLTKEEIEKHIDELYVEFKDKRQLDWMPKK